MHVGRLFWPLLTFAFGNIHMDKTILLIFADYAPIIFAALFISALIMVGYLMEKGLYPIFKVFKEEALIFPFKFRDYAKKNNKFLLLVYYFFMTSIFLLFIVLMTELYFIIKTEAPIVIQYIEWTHKRKNSHYISMIR